MDIEVQHVLIIVQSIGDVDTRGEWESILLILVLRFPKILKIIGKNYLQTKKKKEQTIQINDKPIEL
jgi:hypothetical protein